MLNGRPLCIDGYCGLGGWSEGFLAEGWTVIGFDIERHIYGESKYPGQLVLQDMLTVWGAQLKDADCLVMSPPCQNYSYLAMPWSRSKSEHSQKAKALRRRWETEGPDNRLFDACFRIQREAIEAAGHFIPLIVENVRGANEWVSPKSRYNYGSFHLWGDVPAIMPIQSKGAKVPGFRFDGSGGSFQTAAVESTGQSGEKGGGGSWFAVANNTNGHSKNPVHAIASEGVKVASADGGRRTDVGKGARFTSRDCGVEGTKIGGDWFRDPACHSKHGSKSNARKAASAQIAKIPFELSSHIARIFKPK